MKVNLAIIGGGPAGYTAAERAAAAGWSVVLFEKNSLGGVCLNEGCIPTKTLLYSAKLYDSLKSMPKYGVTPGEGGVADMAKISARKNKVVRKLVAGIKSRMAEKQVTVVMGAAVIARATVQEVEVVCNETAYTADYLIICTGSQSVVPPIAGLSESAYWTSTEALSCTKVPESLTIIGGGVIGMEFASFFNSLGAKVTVVEMAPEILGVIDAELAALLRVEYAKRGVRFCLSSRVVSVNGPEVTIVADELTETITSEHLLVSVGRRASLGDLGLENVSLSQTANGLCVNEQMQTSHPRIFACGDITGFCLLAHTAIREAEVAVHTLLGVKDAMHYQAIPSVVYTNPEVAGTGYTEERLQTEQIPYRVKRLPMSYSGRFVAENEGGSGVCKLLIGENGVLLGAHILGNPASEIITLASMAIEEQLPVDAWQKIIFPHPSVSEILRECLF